jgi:hypothetical protein
VCILGYLSPTTWLPQANHGVGKNETSGLYFFYFLEDRLRGGSSIEDNTYYSSCRKQGGVNRVNKEVAGLTKRLNFPFGGSV